jgi:3-deoxy-manno-octulosonate cytidylyltransferase (CMP-KDO synthetase)
MSVLIVIPARYASTRYPGKPLVQLKGVTGEARSLVRRSWDAARAVPSASRVVIATDDERIATAAREFGAEVAMTPETCRNGTERCAVVLEALAEPFDIVVNLQGDAPLTPPEFISSLIHALSEDPARQVATPVLRCSIKALSGFIEDRRNGRVGATTAVFDRQGKALYFSKEVLPFTGRTFVSEDEIPVFHHVGVYAYRPDALRCYQLFEPGRLETCEGLEQLRFMENGLPVHCIEVKSLGREFWEVNNPGDVERVEKILRELGIT